MGTNAIRSQQDDLRLLKYLYFFKNSPNAKFNVLFT